MTLIGTLGGLIGGLWNLALTFSDQFRGRDALPLRLLLPRLAVVGPFSALLVDRRKKVSVSHPHSRMVSRGCNISSSTRSGPV